MLFIAVLPHSAALLAIWPLDVLLGALVQGVLAGVAQKAAAPLQATSLGGGILMVVVLLLLLLQQAVALLHGCHAHCGT